MKIINVGSGSSGNATFVYDGQTLIQIDSGLAKTRLVKALKEIDKKLDDVQGVFFTHGHGDHIGQYEIVPLAKRFAGDDCLPLSMIADENIVFPYQNYELGSFLITPILLSHDRTCYGYIVHSKNDAETLVYITDSGYISEKNLQYIANADYYIFESNHDVPMLMTSDRSIYLIKRILSAKGHMNNTDAAYYLSLVVGEKTKAVLLAHLSRECNTSDLALVAFNDVYLAQKGTTPPFEVVCLREDSSTTIGKVGILQ